MKIVHFIGASKPWICYLDSETKVVQAPGEFSHVQNLLQYWWDVFCQKVHPSLSPSMVSMVSLFLYDFENLLLIVIKLTSFMLGCLDFCECDYLTINLLINISNFKKIKV